MGVCLAFVFLRVSPRRGARYHQSACLVLPNNVCAHVCGGVTRVVGWLAPLNDDVSRRGRCFPPEQGGVLVFQLLESGVGC